MKLERRIRRLSEKRDALMADLEALPPSHLTARPISGKWSILDIVEHLVLAERVVLQGLPSPSELSERKRLLKHRILYLVVLFVLKARIRVRVPSSKMVPRGGHTFHELHSQWDSTHLWLQDYIAQLNPEDHRRTVFRHPVAGPVTLAQAIQLDSAHVDGHLRQIRRLIRLVANSESKRSHVVS